VLGVCDPKRELQSDEDFLEFWVEIHELCEILTLVRPS